MLNIYVDKTLSRNYFHLLISKCMMKSVLRKDTTSSLSIRKLFDAANECRTAFSELSRRTKRRDVREDREDVRFALAGKFWWLPCNRFSFDYYWIRTRFYFNSKLSQFAPETAWQLCGGRIVFEKGPCNGGSKKFVLEISTLKVHAEAADLQQIRTTFWRHPRKLLHRKQSARLRKV